MITTSFKIFCCSVVSIFPLTKGYWLSHHDDTPIFHFFLFRASSSFRPTLLLSFFTLIYLFQKQEFLIIHKTEV